MRLLHFILADPSLLPPFPVEAWGEPPIIPLNPRFPYGTAVVSILYSDVGPSFYSRCGPGIPTDPAANDKAWIERDPFGTIWPTSEPHELSDDVQWIPESSLPDIWDRDASAIKREVQLEAGLVRDTGKTALSFLPSHGVAQFLLERSRHAIPQRSPADGFMWGAKVVTTESDADPGTTSCPHFATWSLDPGRSRPSTLVITRLRASPLTLEKLLNAARKVAVDFALEQIEVWNLDPGLQDLAGQLGGKTGRRSGDDHLPALAWYRGGDVIWRFNEKFCWC
jgi:hypothetical protein